MGGSVAMECDFLEHIQHLRVQWFMNGNPIIETGQNDSEILYLEGGKFLFIQILTAQQRRSFFDCEISQVINGHIIVSQRAPTTFSLDGVIALETLEVYYGLEDRSVKVALAKPEPIKIVLAAAARTMNGMALLSLSCTLTTVVTTVRVEALNNVVSRITGLEDAGQVNITCHITAPKFSIPPLLQTLTYSFDIRVARK